MKQFYSVAGLTCEACAKLCELRLKRIEGVRSVICDDEAKTIEIEAERQIKQEELVTALAGTSFQVSAVTSK